MDTIPVSVRKVLIGCGYDDQTDDLMKMFDRKEFDLYVTSSGEDAIRHFACHTEILLVILTAELEVISGFEVLGQVKRLRPGIPVFLLSSYISFESLKLASMCGCDEFLQVPVRKKELMTLINKHLHNHLEQSI